MKKIWMGVLTLLMLAVLCTGALAQGNLLANPQIDLTDGAAPEWTADAWDGTRSVLEYSADGGMDGGSCLHIVNLAENDARFVQSIDVQPMSLYHISCYVKAENIVGSDAGANVSAANAYVYSTPVFDTGGEWVLTEMYGVTGEMQSELCIYVRLGGYSATATGEAWFDDICVERVDSVPEGTQVLSLEPVFGQAAQTQEEALQEAKPEPAWLVVFSALFALMAAALLLRFSRGALSQNEIKNGEEPRWIWVLMAFALLARLLTALFVRGFETDINCFLSWSSRMVQTGPAAFYSAETFCDYPPGYLYVLWLCGALCTLFGQTGSGALAVLLIKLPNIVADMAACALLYRYARKNADARSACALAAIYALNPAAILDSAGWGQTDGLLSLALAGALVLFSERKWIKCLSVYALAVLIKPQALLFAPMGVLAMAMEWIKSEDRAAQAKSMLSGLGCAAVIWIGLSMPFVCRQTSTLLLGAPSVLQPVIWLFEKYFATLGSYSYYTVSACNFWDLIGLNWVEIGSGAMQVLGWAAYAAAIAFAAVMYRKIGQSRHIFLVGAAMLAIMFSFGLKMHERYLFPAILLLCLAYWQEKDVRIAAAGVLIGCAQFVNMGLVLMYDWTLFAPTWLVKGTDIAVLSACAVLVWACVDLCARGREIGVTRIYRPSAKRMAVQEKQARRAAGSGLFQRQEYKMHLSRREIWLVAVVTAVYSVFTFVNLGTFSAPQTQWQSEAAGEQILFDLGREREFMLTYYGGICDSTFTVEFSSDGVEYSEPAYAQYDQGEIFRWLWYKPMEYSASGQLQAIESDYAYRTARYVRITAQEAGLVLAEVGFLDREGGTWTVQSVTGACAQDPLLLIDEQNTVPQHPSYYNSSYFDEIYHVRTAYEHIHGMHTYEWTHPPLGKLLIALGIKIFGMCPFGWRFMGALSGVVMVPVMYLLMRQISKSCLAAFFAMMLMTLDCMHFTQSRLGTIDCFAVMFIMLMYLFMFRYVRMSFYHEPLAKTFVPLGMCGVMFALGCATKWICLYAGVGLAALYFYTLWRRWTEYEHAKAGMQAFTPEEKKTAQKVVQSFWRYAGASCLFCCVFFIAVPLLTYYFSYYWQLTPDGNFNVAGVIAVQKNMLSYHSGLGNDTHYFRSPWYEWPLIIKPMWYYSGNEFMPVDTVSSISCMGNPAVWWGGLIGLVYVLVKCVRSRGRDRKSLYLVIGFASQYLPWVLVPRSTFIYHYFASVPFIILCAAVLIEDIERRDKTLARRVAAGWISAAAVLLAMFYPLMSGTPILRRWAKYLRWFNWYNY